MQRVQKREAAEALAKVLAAPTAVFSFDFRGLTVAEVTDLRRRVRDAGGMYRVVKNSTARWAFKEAGLPGLDEHLVGMTGLAWSEDDPVSLARVLHESTRDFTALQYKGGVVAERRAEASRVRPIGPDQFEALARLPGAEALRSQLASVVAAPIRNLMNVLGGVPRNLVLVLKAAEQKAAEGEDAR